MSSRQTTSAGASVGRAPGERGVEYPPALSESEGTVQATMLLLERRHRIQQLVNDISRDERRGDGRHVELSDAVSALVLLEQAVLHLLLPAEKEAQEHRLAHERARAALFRVVGSASNSDRRAVSLRELADIFGARSSALFDALSHALDEAELLRMGGRLSALLR